MCQKSFIKAVKANTFEILRDISRGSIAIGEISHYYCYLPYPKAPLPEKIPVSDVYHPKVDGHSYSSFDLLQFIRRKGIPKATGKVLVGGKKRR